MPTFDQGFALIVAIANYPKVNRLPQSVLKDGQDIKEILVSPNYCGYQESNIRCLTDRDATLTGIRNGLQWLASVATQNSTCLIFFSGHGGRVTNGTVSQHYLIPYDCDPQDLRGTSIRSDELTRMLINVHSQRLLAIFDCCFAGGSSEPKGFILQQSSYKDGLEMNFYEQLAKGVGRVIMGSSRHDEVSLALPNMKNSLFTHHLLNAFRGSARTRGDGLIRVLDIFDYVSEAVPAHASQHPVLKCTDLENNFPVALYRTGKKSQKIAISTVINQQTLREVMMEAFNLEELEILCADVQQSLFEDGIELPVNFEIVAGNNCTKPNIILKLIGYLHRRGYLAYLVQAVRRHRPGLM